nr:hypothetical protein [Tanacetum cinerariifolium]
MIAHHNDWDTSAKRSESSSSITSSFDTEIVALKAEMAKINKNLMRVLQANDAILKNMQTNMTSLTNLNLELKNKFGQFMKMNTASSSGLGTLLCNTITNPKEDLKGITTRSGTAYQGPTIPTISSFPVVEPETEVTKDTVHPISNGSTEDVQPPVVPTESPILNSEPVTSPIIEPVASTDTVHPISNGSTEDVQPPVVPTESPILNSEPVTSPIIEPVASTKLRDKANDQREKFFQIFKDLNFNISFADALILMPKFGPSIKILLTNKDKLCELARTLLNKHYSAVLLKKLPEKLGDPAKYSQEVLGFSNVIASGNPTPYYEPTVSTTSSTLTPFGNSDFLLKEVDAFLAIEDDPTLPKVDQSYNVINKSENAVGQVVGNMGASSSGHSVGNTEHMMLAKKEESGVPLTDDEYGLLAHAAAAEEDEEEDLLANYIFMAKLHKATSDSEDDAESTYHTDSLVVLAI